MYHIVVFASCCILFGLGLCILLTKSLFLSVILAGIFSSCSAVIYCLLKAPDVAITEAAVNAFASSVFFLGTLSLIGSENISTHKTSKIKKVLFIVPAVAFFAAITTIVGEFGVFGDPNTIANLGVGEFYLNHTEFFFGVENVVTAVLGGFRGFDTLMETTVVFAASFGVAEILKRKNSY